MSTSVGAVVGNNAPQQTAPATENADAPTLIEGKGVFLPFQFLARSSAAALTQEDAAFRRTALPSTSVDFEKTLTNDSPGRILAFYKYLKTFRRAKPYKTSCAARLR